MDRGFENDAGGAARADVACSGDAGGLGSAGGNAFNATAVAYRLALFNLLTGSAGSLALSFIKFSFVPGFVAGYVIGVVNVFWLIRIVRKGVLMEPEKAGRAVARNYYLRFTATLLVIALMIVKEVISPFPLLIGLTGCIFTTIGVMIFSALEEAY